MHCPIVIVIQRSIATKDLGCIHVCIHLGVPEILRSVFAYALNDIEEEEKLSGTLCTLW